MEGTWVRRKSLGRDEKRGRRESLGKDFERKLNVKPEISIEKCKEEIAFYTSQTETFFEEEWGLIRGGLNPKLASDVAFVTDADLEGLFGKCTKLRTTNTFLAPDARQDLMELYSKIYGSHSVTNNEFSGWLVKGYIANLKKKRVNWALAASTTALEKADRAQRLLLRLLNPESSEEAAPSGFQDGSGTSQLGGISSRLGGAMAKIEGGEAKSKSTLDGLRFTTLCPYGVSSNNLEVVRDVSKVESELLSIARSKVRHVEAECKKISERLLGFKFTKDDRCVIAKEDEEKVLQFQVQFEKATRAVQELELQAGGISKGSVELDDLEQKLKIMQRQMDSIERKLEVSKSVADSSRERAMKGQDFFEDIESEQVRAESDLHILRREIMDLERFSGAVVDQCTQMEKGSGLSLWPKPALHPAMGNDGSHVNTPTLQLHPCVFCNRGYPYYDIVIASCTHIYYIFCAAALAKVDNRCTRCHEVFHPHWWQNFGFQSAYSGFEEESLRLEVVTNMEAVRESLKENGSQQVLNWMQSSLKHSDWGSCGSPQRSCLPITTGHNIGMTEVQMLPSLASFSPGEEPAYTEIEPVHPELGRDQEVESPVKARGVERCSIWAQHSKGDPDVPNFLVAPSREDHDIDRVGNDCEPSGIPKFRCSLLKRPTDLLEDEGDTRKKVALSSFEANGQDMAVEFNPTGQSSSNDTTDHSLLNSGSPKGKTKSKNSKRKSHEALPCTTASRVSTRADSRKG